MVRIVVIVTLVCGGYAPAQETPALNLKNNAIVQLGFASENELLVFGREQSFVWFPHKKEKSPRPLEVTRFAIPNEGGHYLARGREKTLGFLIVDKASHKVSKVIDIDTKVMGRITVGKNLRFVACLREGTLEILDLENPKAPVVRELKPGPALDPRNIWMQAVAFSPNGKRIAVGRNDHCVVILEGDRWEKTLEFPAFHRTTIRQALFLPDNRRLLTLSASNELFLGTSTRAATVWNAGLTCAPAA